MRFAIVVARFNRDITEPLCAGAEKALREHGAADVTVVWVPGAFELPLVAKRFAAVGHGRRGGLPRRGHPGRDRALRVRRGRVPRRASRAPSLDTGIPVIFGVLTVDDREQAFDRLGGYEGHKGEEAALTAIEMVVAAPRDPVTRDPVRHDRHVVHAHAPDRSAHRRADCTAALGDARRVVNVGAGTGQLRARRPRRRSRSSRRRR